MLNTEQPAYRRFRDLYAERIRPVVAWVGAGLSTAADLPSWRALRAFLEDDTAAKIGSFEPHVRDRRRAELASVKLIDDYWIAFGRLRDILGKTSYEAAIREAFKVAETAPIPGAYSQLWNLRIAGILTLNLDRFAARSFPTPERVALNEVQSGFDAAVTLTY